MSNSIFKQIGSVLNIINKRLKVHPDIPFTRIVDEVFIITPKVVDGTCNSVDIKLVNVDAELHVNLSRTSILLYKGDLDIGCKVMCRQIVDITVRGYLRGNTL